MFSIYEYYSAVTHDNLAREIWDSRSQELGVGRRFTSV